MSRIASTLLLALAIFLILLGGIFVIASGVENMIAGGILILIAVLLLFLNYRSEKIEAARPKLLNQTYNVTMGGSGKMEEKKLACRSCGAPLQDKDLKVIDGGIMAKCPYCGSVYAVEEAPKW